MLSWFIPLGNCCVVTGVWAVVGLVSVAVVGVVVDMVVEVVVGLVADRVERFKSSESESSSAYEALRRKSLKAIDGLRRSRCRSCC